MTLQTAVILAALIVVLGLLVVIKQAVAALVAAIDTNTQTIRDVVDALAGEDDELADEDERDEREADAAVPRYFKDLLKSSPGGRLRELARKWRQEN